MVVRISPSVLLVGFNICFEGDSQRLKEILLRVMSFQLGYPVLDILNTDIHFCPTMTKLKTKTSFSDEVQTLRITFTSKQWQISPTPRICLDEKMDLGFGDNNQKVGNLAQRVLLESAKAQEAVLQDELDQYDTLLDDTTTLAELRAKRLQEMQQEQKMIHTWRSLGHGTYQDLGQGQDSRDAAQDFFRVVKESERVVALFYRPATEVCQVLHKHLAKLADQHLETRFVKINVQDCDITRKGASFLVERLKVIVMPTIVLVNQQKVVHQIRGLDELGGADFTTRSLERLLVAHQVLKANLDDDDFGEDDEAYESHSRNINRVRVNDR